MGVRSGVRQALSDRELVAVVEARNLTGDPVLAGQALVQVIQDMRIGNVIDNRIDVLEAETSQLRIHLTKDDFPPDSPGGPGDDLGSGTPSAPHPYFSTPLNSSIIVVNLTFTDQASTRKVRPRDTLQVPVLAHSPAPGVSTDRPTCLLLCLPPSLSSFASYTAFTTRAYLPLCKDLHRLADPGRPLRSAFFHSCCGSGRMRVRFGEGYNNE